MSKSAKIIIVVASLLIVGVVLYFILRKKPAANTVKATPNTPNVIASDGSKQVSDLSNGLAPDINSRLYTPQPVYAPTAQSTGGGAAQSVSTPYVQPRESYPSEGQVLTAPVETAAATQTQSNTQNTDNG